MSKRFLTIACLLLCLLITLPAQAQSPAWSCRGPFGGAMRSLAISPAFESDHTLLAGAEQGGLFRSTDAGLHWQSVGGVAASLPVASIALSPAFAQDGVAFLASTRGGVLRSVDGGLSWATWSDGIASLAATDVALSPLFDTDQIALAATDRGIYKTASAGKRWAHTGPDMAALSVALGPGAEDQLIALGGTATGLYRSVDGGDTWQETELSGMPITALGLSPNLASDGLALAGTLAGIYRSDDGGQTWQGPWFQEQVVYSVAFSPAMQDNTLLAGTAGGLYVSTDAGLNWQKLAAVQDAVRTLVTARGGVAGLAVWAGTARQGLLYTDDLASAWEPRHTGITGRVMRAVTTSPAFVRDVTVFAGGADGLWRSVDDGQTWELSPLNYAAINAIQCSPRYATNRTVYAASSGGVFISHDQGQQWQPTTGVLPALNVNDLAVADNDHLWIATADGGVFYSEDDGATWWPRSEGLGTLHVTSLAWLGSEYGQDRVLAGTWGYGVYYSENGGLLWTAATDSPQTPHIRALAAAEGFDGRMWSFAGSTAGIFRSGNRGLTWDFAGLLGLDIAGIALHPDYATRPNAYVGSPLNGVLRSLNGGLTWQPLNTGLGSLQINGLATGLDDTGQAVLFAATQSGVWRHGTAPRTPAPPEISELWLPLLSKQGPVSGTASQTTVAEPQAPQRADR